MNVSSKGGRVGCFLSDHVALGAGPGQRSNQLSRLATRTSLEQVKMGAKRNIISVL